MDFNFGRGGGWVGDDVALALTGERTTSANERGRVGVAETWVTLSGDRVERTRVTDTWVTLSGNHGVPDLGGGGGGMACQNLPREGEAVLRLRGEVDCGQEAAEMSAQTCGRRRSVGAVGWSTGVGGGGARCGISKSTIF